jgi:hypothetical protein
MDEKGKLFDIWMKCKKDWSQCKAVYQVKRTKGTLAEQKGGFVLAADLGPYFANDPVLVQQHVDWCLANNMWKRNPNNPEAEKLHLYWVHMQDTVATQQSQKEEECVQMDGEVDTDVAEHLAGVFGDTMELPGLCAKASAIAQLAPGSAAKQKAKAKPKAKAKAVKEQGDESGEVVPEKAIDQARAMMARIVKERANAVNLSMQLTELEFSEQLQSELDSYATKLQSNYLKLKRLEKDAGPDDALMIAVGEVETMLAQFEYKCALAKGVIQQAQKAAKKQAVVEEAEAAE